MAGMNCRYNRIKRYSYFSVLSSIFLGNAKKVNCVYLIRSVSAENRKLKACQLEIQCIKRFASSWNWTKKAAGGAVLIKNVKYKLFHRRDIQVCFRSRKHPHQQFWDRIAFAGDRKISFTAATCSHESFSRWIFPGDKSNGLNFNLNLCANIKCNKC